MKRMRPLIYLIALLLPGSFCKAQSALDSVLDTRPHAWWGSMVVEVASGDTLFTRNAARSFMPASVTKLFTTAAVLDQLGPDYRYVTRLYAEGTQTGDVLEGNLLVRGAGDPSTGAAGDDWMNLFHAFADSLLALGIQEVRGDLIGDDNVFDDVPLGADWSWEDLVYGYAAQISGLTFYDAIVDLHAYPTRPGIRGELSITPDSGSFLMVDNQTLTLPQGQELVEGHTRIPESNRIIVSSQVPVGRSDPEAVTIHNPTLYFLHGLRTVLTSRNIHVHGQLLDVDDLSLDPDYSAARVIASHTSAPLSELVATVNKESHNLYAEHLLKTLGRERPEPGGFEPGSAAMGIEASMRTYENAQIETDRLQLVDGSGLSRKNLITPAMTIALLRYMALHPNPEVRDAFLSSLAVGGQDGTLEYRFIRNSPGYGRVRAKTGTLGNVNSLAGYLMRNDGSLLAFVIFANHFQGHHAAIREIQESFINELIDLPLERNN